MKGWTSAGLVLFTVLTATVAAAPTGAATVEGHADLAFGSCGVSMVLPVDVEVGEGKNGSASAVAVQPDGKIVMASRIEGPEGLLGVTRLMPDGSLDYGFGPKGTVFTYSSGGTPTARAIAVQGDGKIVVEALRIPYDGLSSSFWFARYLPGGAIDPSFGTNGTVNLEMNNTLFAMALQADGRILASGYGTVVRLLTSGALDPTFGSGGVAPVPGTVTALATQPDGKVVAGGIVRGTRNDDFAVHRLLPSGALDPSFGTGGGSTLDSTGHDTTLGVAVDGNGRIVLAGGAAIDGGSAAALVRFLPDGRLDSSGRPRPPFSPGGTATGVGTADAERSVAVGLLHTLDRSGGTAKISHKVQ